jgi:hypothetical protein
MVTYIFVIYKSLFLLIKKKEEARDQKEVTK